MKNNKNRKRRKGIVIMGQLIGLIKPLLPIMMLAIFFGVIGYLCAIFLTILAGYGVLGKWMHIQTAFDSFGNLLATLLILAVLRGVFHYQEQYCNHFIAFKLLALIRHKVFAMLRKLCPAKLEGKEKGNLISMITSDIELLEVFYAHTISPIAIALLTSGIMIYFLWNQHWEAGLIGFLAYITVGGILPLWNGKRGASDGMKFRDGFGELNSFILDSMRGLDETIQYGQGKMRQEKMNRRSVELGNIQKKLNRYEATQSSVTNFCILFFSCLMLLFMVWNYQNGQVTYGQMVMAVIGMMSSFGPVVALSNLSNNLNQTLACGERVLSLLEEKPQVEEIISEENITFDGAKAEHVFFYYDSDDEDEKELILNDYSMEIPKGSIIGIHGVSGSGKSTFLKLLMRFWDTKEGSIQISGNEVREIGTSNLRNMEAYVTQETYLFHDSIANNLTIGKQDATMEEMMEAAKKASIHEWILSLPNGYDTQVGELGDTLSGGERQRIGIARAFLHDAPLLLLDEPTSNLDSLNEGMILKSLKDAKQDKTVVLVSHRKSTMNLADIVYKMENGSAS